jgi:FeS assembly SUF system regulator
MIRMSRLTDYGIVLMSHVAAHPERVHNAAELAAGARLPLPTVAKLLRILAGKGLLISHRGAKGGYRLALPAEKISVARLIGALEGPVALTVCAASASQGNCEHEPLCPIQPHWLRINRAIREALESVTLADMASPLAARSAAPTVTSQRARLAVPAKTGAPH